MRRLVRLRKALLAPGPATSGSVHGTQPAAHRFGAAAAVAVLSLLLTVPWAAAVAPWADESATLMAVRRSWQQLAGMYQGSDAPLVPYYAIVKLAVSWLPTPDQLAAARLVSAVAVALAAAAAVLIASRRLHLLAGLLSGVFFISLPGVTRFALEARPYALVMAFSALAWLAFDLPPRPRRTLTYLAAAASAILLHAFALFQLPAQSLLAVVERSASWRKAALLPAVAAILALPQLYLVATHGSGPGTVQLDGSSIPTTLVRLITNQHDPLGASVLACLLLLSLASFFLSGRPRHYRRLARLAWLWFGIPVAAALAVGLVRPSLLRARYLTPALAPAAILSAVGILVLIEGVLHLVRGRARLLAAIVALVGVLAIQVGLTAESASFARSPAGHQVRIWKAVGVIDALLQEHPDAPLIVDSATQSLVFEVAQPGLLQRNPLYHYDFDQPRPWASRSRPTAQWAGRYAITATTTSEPKLSRAARKSLRGYTRTSLQVLGTYWVATWELKA